MPAVPVRSRSSWWQRLLRACAGVLLVLLAAIALLASRAFRDRNPGYSLDLRLPDAAARAEPRPLQVGFSRTRINPDLSNPRRPVWLAGFSQNRAATGLHDDLWAIACVVDDGHTRVGWVALDAIGFFHDDVIEVRRRLEAAWKLDYVVVCATHNHSTPDLMGLWGPNWRHSGVDPRYREQVIAAGVQVLGQAVAARQPARLVLHEIPTSPEGLLTDTRRPEVYDPDLRVLQFLAANDPRTLGTVVAWANHPETVWSQNTEITSDFCGYLRDALEHGVRVDDQVVAPGVGGVHLYVNGAVGGLMTTSGKVTVRDPYRGEDFKEPSHAKARALGLQLVSRVLPRLTAAQTGIDAKADVAPVTAPTAHAPISVRAQTLELPLDNLAFFAAPILGLLDRGHVRWAHLRSEIALITLGDASLLCIPGEIYPELVNGGIERAPGGDFDVDPVEVPPLRALMPGKVKFLLGMANDEIGYIIPKSEWDREPPYLYGSTRGVYGEINSVGPETAERIHAVVRNWTTVR